MSKIYLIAGHHEADSGASVIHPDLGKVTEADLTKELRDLIYSYIKAHNSIEIIKDNDALLLQAVLNEINKTVDKDDIIVDIHFNAFNGKATGTEVFIPTINSELERTLASNICKRLADIMSIANRGVKTEEKTARKRIAILRGVGKRILIEVCFMDNIKELNSYIKNKHLVAEAIAFELENIIKNA